MNVRTITSAILRTIGYTSMVLQWQWAGLIALPLILKSDGFNEFISPDPQAEPSPVVSLSLPTELSVILGGIVVVFFIVLTAYILLRAPRVVQKTGDKLVANASHKVIPILTHHAPLPAKQRQLLTRRIILAIQLLLTLTPFVITLLLPTHADISRNVVIVLAGVLAMISIAALSLGSALRPKQSTSRTRSHASRG